MCQICTDLAEFEEHVDAIVATELAAALKAEAAVPAALCGHAYVNSAGHCLHCDADLSKEIAAAVDSLNASIQQTLHAEPCSQHVPQQTSAEASPLMTHPPSHTRRSEA